MACSTCGSKSPFSKQQQLVINQNRNAPTVSYERQDKVKAIRGVIKNTPVPYPLPVGPTPTPQPSSDKE